MSEWIFALVPWVLLVALWVWIARVLGAGRTVRAAGPDGAVYLFERRGISRQAGAVTVTIEWAAVAGISEGGDELLVRAAEYQWRVLLPRDDRARKALGKLLLKQLGSRAPLGLLRPTRIS
jgi:hypothetical protein